MKKRVNPLSDVQLRTAKAKNKDYKLSDGQGLYVLVNKSGSKLWRFDYTFNGKRKTYAMGSYPSTSLSDARIKREEAKQLLAKGFDPMKEKQLIQAQMKEEETTFKSFTDEWLEAGKSEWSKDKLDKIKRYSEKYLYPAIGRKPLKTIETPELYQLLKGAALHSAYTAQRLRSILEHVFTYAIINGKAKTNPAISLKGTLPSNKVNHLPAPTKATELAPILKAIDAFNGTYILKQALKILPQLLIRPGNLREMEWSEIDFDGAVWSIPGQKMKMKEPHITPLSKQVLSVLSEIQALTGSGKYVFPNHRTPGKPLSRNSFNEAFRRMGFTHDDIVAHGFRATARTMLHEVLKFRPDVIEAQLAHKVPDRLGSAYNRTKHLEDRAVMLQDWSDYLDGLKQGAKVIPLKRVDAF